MTRQQLGNEPSAVARSLLNEFFNRPLADDYEDQLRCVSEEMGRCVIFISDLPSHLSEVFSSGF